MTDKWTCAGCGISGPDTDRRCDCATAVVVCGKEGEWKTGPMLEEMRARADIDVTASPSIAPAPDVTDAPERIYAWVYRNGDKMHHNWRGAVHPCGTSQTEYVRADLATSLDDPRVLALMKKARAVVDRWDSPLWKDLPHTGESIADLRAALSALEKNK